MRSIYHLRNAFLSGNNYRQFFQIENRYLSSTNLQFKWLANVIWTDDNQFAAPTPCTMPTFQQVSQENR